MSSSYNIGIVDDEAIIRKSLEMILQKHGYEVISAKNGELLLELIDLKPAEVYLIDLDLPGMSGAELAEHILARQPEAKIISLSGALIEEDSPLLTLPNVVATLVKPVEIGFLLETIQAALGSEAERARNDNADRP